jgi:ATP-dependent DNA helicase DinG
MSVIGPTSDAPLRRAPVAVIDWETTWSDDASRTQHPVSVAVVHCELGVRGSERVVFQSLIKPVVSIRPEAEKIHGISDEKVKDAPYVEDIAERLEAMLDGRVVASYNIPFDVPIMQRYVNIPFGTLDPLVWARVVDQREARKNLSSVAARRGIRFNAHDAVADAVTTAKIMPMLLAELKAMPRFDAEALESIAGIWRYTVKEALEWDRWFAANAKRRGRDVPDTRWEKLLA